MNQMNLPTIRDKVMALFYSETSVWDQIAHLASAMVVLKMEEILEQYMKCYMRDFIPMSGQ